MKNLNNKILFGILAGLILIVALAKLVRAPRLQRTLPETLVEIDTAAADAVHLYPVAERGVKLEFRRKENRWIIIRGKKEATVEQGSVSTMLAYFVNMSPKKLITQKREKWSQYAVGDSSTRVVVMKDNKTIADIRIGRTGFDQPQGGQMNPYGMGGFGSSFTYVRTEGEDDVYAVDGFLESVFNRGFNDWRDKSFLRIKAEQVERLRFNYPDSGFVAERKNEKWQIGMEAADSVKVNEYLTGLAFRNGQEFADDYQPSGEADLALVIEGDSGILATVKAWKRPADYVLSTSRQPGIYFTSDAAGLLKNVFETRKNLMPPQ